MAADGSPHRRAPRRLSPRWRGAAAAILLLCPASGWAADVPPSGAVSCSGCHAPAGTTGGVPGITGRPAAEIVAAMSAFRDGSRPATVMDRIAKGFSDEEISAIAAWLAQQRDAAAAAAQP